MDKAHIIAEIRRTAAANGGKPLGMARFEQETGIKIYDWYGKHWARWGDALEEAGYQPNSFQRAFDDNWIIEQLISMIREIGRYPTSGEIRLRCRIDSELPSHGVFFRLGRKVERAKRIVDFCSVREGYGDILDICRPIAAESEVETIDDAPDDPTIGYVYLIKSGKHYKIGHTNSAGRRVYELAIQLPQRATMVHTIRTDDPPGIEAYWHKRFEVKRLHGEWFSLNAADIRAFKRRRFM